MALKWSICEKFSDWLKGHTFTVWTDNNPLTYLLSKPKLDYCEQRWVAKLASYTFDLKHIPGTKNVVADALSRDPFAKPVGQRLLSEPYHCLLREVEGTEGQSVQDVFRLTCQSQSLSTLVPTFNPPSKNSYTSVEVGALYQAHCSWEFAAEIRAVRLAHHVQQLAAGQDTLPIFSSQELQQSQQQDPCIARVFPFIQRKRRPSRREKHGLDSKAFKLFMQWDKLEIVDGILYRVTKDPNTKLRRF